MPRDACTSSLADWLSPAAARFSWLCASWKLLVLGGNWRQGEGLGEAARRMEIEDEGLARAWGYATAEPGVDGPAHIPTRLPLSPPTPAQLTESASSLLLASPTMRMAASTSRCPGRQLTQRFRACDTALATCGEAKSGQGPPASPMPFPWAGRGHPGSRLPLPGPGAAGSPGRRAWPPLSVPPQ